MSNLFYNAASVELLNITKSISSNTFFADFRLCGGTALALQVGHRVSLDADFVSEKSFDQNEILKSVKKNFKNVTDVQSGTHGVFLKVNGIKIDFLTWNIPFIRPVVERDGILLAHVEEIIAMKLFAITQRGEKKDYMDISSMLKYFTLKQMLSFFNERHPENDELGLLRYLSSYSDVEHQPEPVMLNNLTWHDCKQHLQNAIQGFF